MTLPIPAGTYGTDSMHSQLGFGVTHLGISIVRGTFDSYTGSNVFPMDQSTHYGFSAKGTISRTAFGVSFGVPMVTDEVDLFLEVQFVSPASD
ncbi:MAG: hypothetical protein P8N02_14830 [Actinomycetota bacterium]|nr:hypothetical protein [Actinomycetota bacterium]